MASASAKRPREEEDESDVYPFMAAIDISVWDADAMINATKEKYQSDLNFLPMDVFAQSSRWPYWYALPTRMSSTTHTHFNLQTLKSDEPVKGIKMMPRSQQVLVESYAPKNIALLQLWKHAFAAIHALHDRTIERRVILSWTDSGFVRMRAVLRDHPLAGQLTDLVSMIPIVEEGLEEKNKFSWSLYDRFFMPGPDRVGVALPVGIVLFEGRSSDTEPTKLLEQRVRLAPFSTSWHINVGIDFANRANRNGIQGAINSRDHCLFVHKIMSDGIIGVDVQMFTPSVWLECEIIIQPLVSIHLVEEVIIAIDYRKPPASDAVIAQRVLFTHVFLGDTCPCEAHAAAESNKQQRLDGRMKLLIHQ